MKRCEYVSVDPEFMKSGIDIGEFYDFRGAFLWNTETRCAMVADPGHAFCPRHELMDSVMGPALIYRCPECHTKAAVNTSPCQCGEPAWEMIPAVYEQKS